MSLVVCGGQWLEFHDLSVVAASLLVPLHVSDMVGLDSEGMSSYTSIVSLLIVCRERRSKLQRSIAAVG